MKRCGECGSTNIVLRSAKGKFFPYKDHRRVPLLYDYQTRTCSNCENIILSNKDIWEINELLAKSISVLAKNSIKDITYLNDVSQIDVAKMLGQTPEYISNLKSGNKVPSYSTLTLMRIYAKYPAIMEEFTGFKARQFMVSERTGVMMKDESLGWKSVPQSSKISNDFLSRGVMFHTDTHPTLKTVPNQEAVLYSKTWGKVGLHG